MNYLIYGSSFRLVDVEVKKILNGRTSNAYSLEEVSLKEILDDLGYDSMFQEEKVLILRDFETLNVSKEKADKTLASLESYLDAPNANTTLIFTSKEKISASRGVLKNIVSKLEVIETPIITKPYELPKIFGEVIRKSGYNIAPNTLDSFCEKCASNYDIAASEFEKLRKIKGRDTRITDADIDEHVSNYNMTDSFGFKDAVINMNIPKATKMLDDLETSKMELVPLVVMLAKEYIALYNIKLLASKKMTNDQIGNEMGGMHPYRVKLLRDVSNKYTPEKLESLILYLCNLDKRLISEDNLGYDELRKFILEL